MINKNLPNKKLLILLGALLFFLLILILVSIKQKETQNQLIAPETGEDQEEPVDTGVEPGTSRLLSPPKAAPQLSFSSIDTTPTLPDVPNRVMLYSLKSNYLPADVTTLGNKLGLTENKIEGNNVLVYNLNDESKRAYLQFDLTNGSFNFQSYGNQTAVGIAGQPATEVARNFLANLGVIDNSVTCSITYQRKEISGVTFVECHRDWQRVGMPVLSFTGLINVPDNQAFADIKVGEVDENFGDDPSVINTSTGQDGKKRPDDFNTATVAVADNGEILSVTSNIRQVKAVSEVLESSLLSSSEAWENFKAGASDLSFIAPVTSAGVSWEEVFPNNQAVGSGANITDFLLAYLEQPGAAKELAPMYLIRGTTQLASGYQARFIQAVSAMRKSVSEIYPGGGSSAGVVAAATAGPFDDETLKLGTFNPEQRTQVWMNETAGCVPSVSQLNPLITLAGMGMLGKWTIDAPAPGDTTKISGVPSYQQYQWYRSQQWYLVPNNYQALPAISEFIAAFDALNLTGRGSNLRDLSALQKEWQRNQFCPLRGSGGSPTLHIYGKPNSNFTIKVGKEVVYSNPGYNKGWDISVGPNNALKVNNQSAAYVYYEYAKVNYDKPTEGWVTTYNNLTTLANNIGNSLGLNPGEVNSLIYELKHAASQVNSNQLYVAPISQNEVDQKVPLSVTDVSFKVARYHFYVREAVANQKPVEPLLTPLNRVTNLIVELGAVSSN